MDEIKDIILKYKGEMSWDEFVEQINHTPKLEKRIKRSAVNNWGIGESYPRYYFMSHLAGYGKPFIQRMAAEVLHAMNPNEW